MMLQTSLVSRKPTDILPYDLFQRSKRSVSGYLVNHLAQTFPLFNHDIKYARIRVFTDPYSPYKDRIVDSHTEDFGLLKIRLLAYFMQ